MIRPYLVHSCFNPTLDFQVWKTQKRPKECSCKLRLSREDVNYWLDEGVITPMVVGWTLLGEKPSPTLSDDVFCFTNRANKTPRVATIESKHIHRAYVEGLQWAQDRITEWGRLERDLRLSLMVPWRDDPTSGQCLFLAEPDDKANLARRQREIDRKLGKK